MPTKIAPYFKISSKIRVRLSKFPVLVQPKHLSQVAGDALLANNHALIEEHQVKLYAGHSKSLLIIFQGMDTAGKDGAIKHVMSGVNPQGCSVISFKPPSQHELDHDFLWRANRALPARGQIGIFNRSYYEEALITRVHPKLIENERLPSGKNHDESFWRFRYLDIVRYEKYLHRQGCEIIKIFIHVSRSEQKKRLLDRFNDPKKLWKISEGDIHERSFWKQYQLAYEHCLSNTASKSSPWYIVPGDDKASARLSISQILVDRFARMDLKYPTLNQMEQRHLRRLKSQLLEA